MKEKYLTEAEQAYTFTTVMEEAQRCLLCHDAPCTKACPAQTDPAKFIRSVRFRNFKGAAETIRINNTLGGVCARVCPTEKYCELACSRCGIDKPINIGGIQRFVTDFEEKADMQILEKLPSKGKKIALVGSGPGNLTSASELLQLGYDVELFEANEKAGGYLTYGIPEYRLPQHVVDVEIKRIEDLGAKFHLNTRVGKDIDLETLKKDFDAVIIGVGSSVAKTLPMFENNKYTTTAVEFLKEVKSKNGEVELPKNVVVIGGGDVAMDVSTTLKKLDVPFVTDVIYEESHEFVASKKELEGTRNEGVTMIDGYAPVAVNDKVITFKHRELNSTLEIEADLIILAVGQKVEDALGLEINRNEVTFEGAHVENTNVFVTGDLAQGDKTVVWAVKKGKDAAKAVDAYLGGVQ